MFDIGFLELLVIMIIALLVIGPERMPEVARKIGSFMGKTRRFINSVKSEGEVAETIQDFKQSMNLEEEQRQISNISDELNKGLSVGMENVNMDDLHRPFGQTTDHTNETTSLAGSQFNKAPSQPQIPNQQTTSNSTESATAIVDNKQPLETASQTVDAPQATEEKVAAKEQEPSDSTPTKA